MFLISSATGKGLDELVKKLIKDESKIKAAVIKKNNEAKELNAQIQKIIEKEIAEAKKRADALAAANKAKAKTTTTTTPKTTTTSTPKTTTTNPPAKTNDITVNILTFQS